MSGSNFVLPGLGDLSQAISDYIAQRLSFERTLGRFRDLAATHSWDWLGLPDKRAANWRAGLILRACSAANYSLERMEQLADQPIWVFRCGAMEDCAHHQDINGLVRPANDPIWDLITPPLDWDCGCYLIGSSTERGAERIGGSSSVEIPSWVWHRPKTGPFGTDPQDGNEFITGLVELIALGKFKAPTDG